MTNFEIINERLATMSLDAEQLALALVAVETDCEVSASVINAVKMALSGHAGALDDLSQFAISAGGVQS